MSAFIGLSGILAHAHTLTWGRGYNLYIYLRKHAGVSCNECIILAKEKGARGPERYSHSSYI